MTLTDFSHFTYVETPEDGGALYTTVVWSARLKRRIRLAYPLKVQAGRRSYVVLFSSDGPDASKSGTAFHSA